MAKKATKRKKTRGKKTTPYSTRFNGRGTLAFDHTFGHIGRIRKASGTHDRDRFREYLTILKRLYQDPRKWKYLEQLRDGEMKMLEIWALHLSGELWKDDDPRTLYPIHPTIQDWIHGYRKWAPTTHANYKVQWAKFLEVVDTSRLIKDLPETLETFYEYCQDKGYHRKFGLLHSIVSKYVNVNLGTDHELYGKIRRVEQFSRARKKETRPLTQPELFHLIARLPPPHDRIAETLACCGLHLKELWTDGIEVDTDYSIRIRGEKRTGRDRRIPKIIDEPLITPPVTREGFRQALSKYTEDIGHRTPKDLRGTFKWLLQAAHIDPTRIDYYCGWNPQRKIGGLYSSHDYEQFIKDDLPIIEAEINRQLQADPTYRGAFSVKESEDELTDLERDGDNV